MQDLADKFEKKQVFTLSGSDSEFYVKDGIVPTTVGQLYIDENGFMRVVMPDVSGMSTLNATFDARIAASQSSGSSLDSEFGYTIPEYNSLSSISEYYGFGEASNGDLNDPADPLYIGAYSTFVLGIDHQFTDPIGDGNTYFYVHNYNNKIQASSTTVQEIANDLIGNFVINSAEDIIGFVRTESYSFVLVIKVFILEGIQIGHTDYLAVPMP